MATELQTRGNTSLTRPDFIKEGVQGHENIDTRDIKLPALRIAQSTSPETKRSKPERYIEGLREGEFFNSLTKDIYGEDPLGIIVVNPVGHRYVQFDKDGKVIDFNVKDGDPRTEFTDEVVDGQTVRNKPKATKFLDFVVLVVLPDGRRQLMTMSLKSTQLKKGGEILSIIAGSKLPCFAYQFSAIPVPEGGGDRTWYGWRFTQGWPSEEAYLEAEKYYEMSKTKNVIVDADETGDGTASDEKVPF